MLFARFDWFLYLGISSTIHLRRSGSVNIHRYSPPLRRIILLNINIFQVQNYKSSLETSKQRVVSLENELLLATKQLEEEKARQRELKRKMDEANAGRARAEERGEQRLAQAHSDLAEVKHRLVELTRYSGYL